MANAGVGVPARVSVLVDLVRNVGVPAAIAFFVLAILAQDVRSVADEVRRTRYEIAAMGDDLRGCLALPPRTRLPRAKRSESMRSPWRDLGLRSDRGGVPE